MLPLSVVFKWPSVEVRRVAIVSKDNIIILYIISGYSLANCILLGYCYCYLLLLAIRTILL